MDVANCKEKEDGVKKDVDMTVEVKETTAAVKWLETNNFRLQTLHMFVCLFV